MEILNLSLPATNRFATEYLAETKEILEYFHYRYNDHSDYKKRIEELKERSFMRTELANHIELYMDKYPTSEKVKRSIEKLKMTNSTVVIGGQQAGILTGPLYTIHKVLSIVALAKQKEAELNIPVVPVFWIAGEDHYYKEVNHIFIEKDQKIEKKIYPEKLFDKRMVSAISLNQELCNHWVEAIIQSFGETEHTKDLLHMVRTAINNSKTFVDFFSYIIMELFKDTGLLIIDSGDERLRKLEKEFFLKQISHFSDITKSVKQQQAELKNDGFSNTIEISNQAVNLFYYDEKHHDRVLLEYDSQENLFIGKDNHLKFSLDEMLEMAGEFPEKLSNNVVTRPLMQEWLFPTLAFIAGPGEIAYWAELKKAFEWFELKMPPIVPRINITFLDRSIETDIVELNLDLFEILTNGIEKEKDKFLESIKDHELDKLFEKTKQDFLLNYKQIQDYAKGKENGLIPLLLKNEARLLKQIDFMRDKFEQSTKIKHEVVLNKFNRVENALLPAGSPQERMLNGLYFINQYGIDFIHELLKCSFTFDGTHKVIKI